MKRYKAAEVTPAYRVERKLTDVVCDICGKVLEPSKERGAYGNWTKYYEVTTGHRDWGNDSCESVKTVDICPECLDKYVSNYFKNTNSTTAYLEIETEIVYEKTEGYFSKKKPAVGAIFEKHHNDW